MKDELSLSAQMRMAALAAPTAAIERQELSEASRQANKERIEKLGSSAELVLDLERRLAAETNDRKRAQTEARYATSKLEQVYQSICSILGRDVRPLGVVGLGVALSDSAFKLTTIAGYIDKAITIEDLVSLKRIASNMGVIPPQSMAESAALMGLPRLAG